MNDLQATVEMSAAVGSAMVQLRRMAAEFFHKHDLCRCHRLYFIETPCEIALEELRKEELAWIWSQWDGIGLGYIGPRLHAASR